MTTNNLRHNNPAPSYLMAKIWKINGPLIYFSFIAWMVEIKKKKNICIDLFSLFLSLILVWQIKDNNKTLLQWVDEPVVELTFCSAVLVLSQISEVLHLQQEVLSVLKLLDARLIGVHLWWPLDCLLRPLAGSRLDFRSRVILLLVLWILTHAMCGSEKPEEHTHWPGISILFEGAESRDLEAGTMKTNKKTIPAQSLNFK